MNMIDEVRIEHERKQFEELGIVEGKRFELVELNGYYIIDIANRSCYAIDHRYGVGLYGYTHSEYPIKGLYDHILDGTWQVLKEDEYTFEPILAHSEEVEKFRKLGIEEGKPFELVELNGLWLINFEKRVAWWYKCKEYMKKKLHRAIVDGAYDNIMNEVWHVLKEDRYE